MAESAAMPWPGPVVLASGSPRRLAFLRSLGVEPVVRPADVDETPRPGEDPVAYVRRLAFDKAMAVPVAAGEVIIAADTTVDVDGTILAKPDDAAHARWMLRSLSGRAHLVHTAFTIRLGTDEHRTATDHDTTTVTCVPISDAEIEWYLGTGEPFDKAGAYAIQGHAAVFVERIDGSVSNVVGLPLHRLVALARSLGVELIRSPAR